MAAAAASVPQTYRYVMRVVRKEITRVAGNMDTEDFVRREFRRKSVVDGSLASSLKLAKDWAHLIESIHGHKVRSSHILTISSVSTSKGAKESLRRLMCICSCYTCNAVRRGGRFKWSYWQDRMADTRISHL